MAVPASVRRPRGHWRTVGAQKVQAPHRGVELVARLSFRTSPDLQLSPKLMDAQLPVRNSFRCTSRTNCADCSVISSSAGMRPVTSSSSASSSAAALNGSSILPACRRCRGPRRQARRTTCCAACATRCVRPPLGRRGAHSGRLAPQRRRRCRPRPPPIPGGPARWRRLPHRSRVKRPARCAACDLGDQLRVRVPAPDPARGTVPRVPEARGGRLPGVVRVLLHLVSAGRPVSSQVTAWAADQPRGWRWSIACTPSRLDPSVTSGSSV